MEELNLLRSNSFMEYLMQIQEDEGDLRRINFLFPLQVETNFPTTNNIVDFLKQYFLDKVEETQIIGDLFDESETPLEFFTERLVQLTKTFKKTLYIKVGNRHFGVGNGKDIIYILFAEGKWNLCSIRFSNQQIDIDAPNTIMREDEIIIEHLENKDEAEGTDTNAVFDIVLDKITEVVNKLQVFQELTEDLRRQLILSISTSAFSIITSITTMCIDDLTTTTKVINCANIGVSLTTLLHGVYAIFKQYNEDFNLNKALSVMPQCINFFQNQVSQTSNADANVLNYIQPAITTIVAAIIGGLTLFKGYDAKMIIQAGNFSKAFRQLKMDATETIEFIIKDICNIDINGDKILNKELIDLALEAGTLAVTPLYKFCTNSKLKNQLLTFQERYQQAASKTFKNVLNSKAAMSAKTTINNFLSNIIEMIKSVQDVEERTGRQETLAILLAGVGGIGKSHLIKPLQQFLSNTFKYENKSYDLTKETRDKFFTAYGGQPYGIVNEFMGTGLRNDGFLLSFNKIISSDHHNMEGSSLAEKHQPAQFKAVFLTSNDLCPNLVGDEGLKTTTAEAVWSRTIRVLVEDPQFKGRMGNNSHRKPDGSHLNFSIVPTELQTELNAGNLSGKLKKISFEQLKELIAQQIALRERNFLNTILRPQIGEHPMITDQQSHKEITERIEFLNVILGQSNNENSDKDFFGVRLQGPPGIGKTRLAGIISGIIKKYQNLPIFNVNSFREAPKTKGIYIIDDKLYSKHECLKYMNWINQGQKDNIYILCSNTIYEKKHPWKIMNYFTGQNNISYYQVKNEENDSIPIPSGFYRRIGLGGTVKYENGKIMQNSYATNLTCNFDHNGNLTLNDIDISEEELVNEVYTKYLKFLRNSNQITITEKQAPININDFDVEILSPNVEELCLALKNSYNISRTISFGFRDTKIKLKSEFINNITAFTDRGEWVVPKTATTEHEKEQLFTKMIRSLLKISESPNVLVKVGSYHWIYSDGVIYKQTKIESDIITYKNGLVYFKNICITPQLYVDLKKADLEQIHDFKIVDISKIDTFINNLSPKKKLLYTYMLSVRGENKIPNITLLAYIEKFKNNKYLWLVAALCGVFATGTLLYKMFSRKEDKLLNYKSNSADYENHALTKHIDRYIKAMLKTDKVAAKAVKDEVLSSGLSQAFNEWEYEWRTGFEANSMALYDPNMKDKHTCEMIESILKSDNMHAKLSVIQDYPHYVAQQQGNMLTCKEERHSNKTLLDNFRHSLLKNYVLVKPSPTTFHYGMGIMGNIILTVSHGIEDDQREVEVESGGKSFIAKVIGLNRMRDLAMLKVQSKSFQSFKDIRKKFLHNDRIREIEEFWYIRVSEKDSMMAGVEATFMESSIMPNRDHNNPLFHLQEKYFRIKFLKVDLFNVIRRGDCGMPLIGFLNNEPYIIGMHNSFSGLKSSLFASIDLETFDALQDTIKANKGEVDQTKTITHPISEEVCVTDQQYKKILSQQGAPSRFTQGDLAPLGVYGYFKGFHIASRPRHKKIFHKLDGAINKASTLPSCIEFIKGKTNPEPLKKDINGNPHTLFTQAYKYSVYTEQYKNKTRNEFKDIKNYTLEMLKFKIESLLGKFRTLNNKEILNGMDCLKPFDITTSCGPAMKMKYGITNKERILQNMNSNDAEKPFYIFSETPEGQYVKQQFYEYDNAIEEGIPIFTVSKNNAKVELLPIDDVVNKSKVRLFNELDFSENLILRKYFGFAINKIMQNIGKTPYCIGANSYTIATDIMLDFNLMKGEQQSSDYSSFDKSLPKEIIQYFVEIFCDYTNAKIVQALTKSLQYTMHILDGHVYFVDHGNESGSVVTTLLNCFAQDFIDTFTAIRVYKEQYNSFPSYQQIQLMYKAYYLGDDGALKVSDAQMTMERRAETAAMYNMKLTPPKVKSEYVSFCSREFQPDDKSLIYFPKLKKSSITSCLFYMEKNTPEQIVANINVALFEASLHDKEFFKTIQHDITLLANKFKLSHKINFFTYEEFRQKFRDYVLCEQSSPILLTIGRQEDQKINIIQSDLLDNNYSNYNQIMSNKNYMELLKEYLDKYYLKNPEYEFESSGGEEFLTWTCKTKYLVNAFNVSFTATGYTKQSAKNKVCEAILKALKQEKRESVQIANNGEGPIFTFEYDFDVYTEMYVCRIIDIKSKRVLSVVSAPTRREVRNKIVKYYFESVPSDFVERSIQEQLKKCEKLCAHLKLPGIYVYLDRKVLDKKDDETHYVNDIKYTINNGREACLNATSQTFEIQDILPYYCGLNIKSRDDGLYYSFNMNANMEREIAPDAIRGTAVNQQASTIPMGQNNPQPTGQVMALAPAGQDAISAIEAIQHQTLNPLGAPNMSTVGAIMFTLPQLCYTQFLDCDKQYDISDQSPAGTIIFQIPYDPLSEFVNPYIKQWVSLHERYQGALQFRITVVGNPMFSGFIGVSWQPRKIEGGTIPISELQKYAYDSKGVTLPWSEIHTLHDARQDLFYRQTIDTDPIENRPHLVVALVASIQNPLKDNAIVRIRVASKLSNSPDSFFSVMKPILGQGPTPPPIQDISVKDIVPFLGSAYMVADGINIYSHAGPPSIGLDWNRTLMQNISTKDAENFLTTNDPFYFDNYIVPRSDESAFFFEGLDAKYTKMRVGIMLATNFLNFNRDLAIMIRQSNTSNVVMAEYFNAKGWEKLQLTNHTIFNLTAPTPSQENDDVLKIFKQVYINGRKGNAVIAFVGYAQVADETDLDGPEGYFPIDAYAQKVAPFGTDIIIESVLYSDGANTVPTGYTAFHLNSKLETIPNFSTAGVTAPSLITHSMYKVSFRNFLKLTGFTGTIIDFDVYDNVNNVLAASVRFTPDTAFIKTAEAVTYKTFPQNIINFKVRNIREVEIGDALPNTDTSAWLNRRPTAFTQRDIDHIYNMLKKKIDLEVEVTSNAGVIAAGALQGLGQGLQSYENFNFQKLLQQNAFTQQRAMQNGYFDGQLRLRGATTQAEMYSQQARNNQPITVDPQTGVPNSTNNMTMNNDMPPSSTNSAGVNNNQSDVFDILSKQGDGTKSFVNSQSEFERAINLNKGQSDMSAALNQRL